MEGHLDEEHFEKGKGHCECGRQFRKGIMVGQFRRGILEGQEGHCD